MTSSFEKITADLEAAFDATLTSALMRSYNGLREGYYLEKHESAVLQAGKFVEAAYRMLEYVWKGEYTPIGAPLPNLALKLRELEKVEADKLHESYRIHIPRVLASIYNIRNKRGVGHLGGDVDPNHVDATLVIASADWTLAEFFRLHYRVSLKEAQQIVDGLAERPLLLVYKGESIRRVLNPSMTLKDQTLLLLAGEHPRATPVADLLRWLEPSDASDYRRRVLKPLHQARYVEYDGSTVTILPPGLRHVDERAPEWEVDFREQFQKATFK